MKRKYVKPTLNVVKVASRFSLLSGSNGVYSSYRGNSFEYGGVDDDGLIDPD